MQSKQALVFSWHLQRRPSPFLVSPREIRRKAVWERRAWRYFTGRAPALASPARTVGQPGELFQIIAAINDAVSRRAEDFSLVGTLRYGVRSSQRDDPTFSAAFFAMRRVCAGKLAASMFRKARQRYGLKLEKTFRCLVKLWQWLRAIVLVKMVCQ